MQIKIATKTAKENKKNTMKKIFFSFLVFCAAMGVSKRADAQWVTIPDANFANWISNYIPGSMIGNQLDTTFIDVISLHTMGFGSLGIHDLTGIQYFDSLINLDCGFNLITFIPSFPHMLDQLGCDGNQLTSLPPLPSSLTSLYCSENHLTTLPTLPSSLAVLECNNNNLNSLPILPNSLTDLYCWGNQIASLPSLPNSLTSIACYNNQITSLPSLPNSLTTLVCGNNFITTIPALPSSLTILHCGHNQLVSLPALPSSLTDLNCDSNSLSSIPPLPNSVLIYFYCRDNQLTSLPVLPDSIAYLYVDDNPSLICLSQLKHILYFSFTNTGIACLPNYPLGNISCSPNLSAFPLCNATNLNGCPSLWNIAGKVYDDSSHDCINQLSEENIFPVKLKLSQSGNLIEQQYSNSGFYSFDTHLNTYDVELDTFNFPFISNCFSNGITDTTVNVTAVDSLISGVDFGLHCLPGFDIGVSSFGRDSGNFIPGRFCLTKIWGGDMSNFYGAHCAAGTGGTVVLTFNGPLTYAGAKAGSIAPSNVSGNVVTWNIADFGTVNFNSDLHIRFHTDTSAQLGLIVCFSVVVTPTIVDNDSSNNHWSQCYYMANSLDPNEKEVSPLGDIDSTQKWLTYTIHFQNTGTATAQHIYVDDTLDTDLDESSFQLLSYSIAPSIIIKGNQVKFDFQNINLPDSNANEPASHGYVQYRIKPKHNLVAGTNINNTAFIYFDFNPAVVTNTTLNTVVLPNEVDQFQVSSFKFQLFPNPAKDELNILFSQQGNYEVKIVDVMGKEILSATSSIQHQTFNIQHLSSGIYFVTVKSKGGIATEKFVRQ